MSNPRLAESFLAATRRELVGDVEVLESLLQSLVTAAQNAWPEVKLPAEVFVRHLGRHLPQSADPVETLPGLYIEDLYLACACAQQLPPALRALEQRYLRGLGGSEAAQADEVQQILRERLLVGSKDTPPKLGEYAGRGSLSSFLRTVAMRVLTDLRRQRGGASLDGDNDGALRALAATQDPELDYIKGRYRREFQTAFAEALQALPLQQRNVLRLRYVDGVNLDGVGAVLGISRATAHRFLGEAREALVKSTQRLLRERLRLSALECASLVRLVHSQIELSIARVFGKPDAAEGAGETP